MKKILKWTITAVVVALIVIQFIGPQKSNPPVEATRTIEANTQMTPEIAAIFERSCRDCHSYKTQWPWYSHVAPVSWLLIEHVNDGRRHLNFSEWASYDSKKARKKLEDICNEVEEGVMPLKSYLLLHGEAKLSQEEVQKICAWVEAERQRLALEGSPGD